MDNCYVHKKHDKHIQDIINMAKCIYKFRSCDTRKCSYSSRLSHIDDESAEIYTFDHGIEVSDFQVFIHGHF